MSDLEPEPDFAASTPIRVAEVTLAAYQWDAWRESVAEAYRRAERTATVAAVLAAAVLAAAGLALLRDESKVSVAIYTPLAGWAVRSWVRGVLSRRAIASAVDQARDVVVPALVDVVDTEMVVNLLRHGGALVTARSTTIVEDRRDSLVALIASEYDLKDVPLNFPSPGGGP